MKSKISYDIKSKTVSAAPIFNIGAPIGGAMNHVRWLVMLDSMFQFELIPNQENYDLYRGRDWPSYEEFIVGSAWKDKSSANIVKEVDSMFTSKIDFDTLNNKLWFINVSACY
jgi:hypothetical protein